MNSFGRSAAIVGLLAILSACASPEERAAEYLAKAQAFLDEGKLDKAKLEARNSLQVQPKNPAANWVLAQIAERKGELGEMLNQLAVVVEEDPKNAKARVKMGTMVFRAQDYEGAASLAKEAEALIPGDPDLHVLKARIALQKEDFTGGIAELDKAIEAEPKHVEAALLRGVNIGAKDPDKGLADLAASIERIGAKDARGLRQARVDLLVRQQRLEEVEKELRTLAADFPGETVYTDKLVDLFASQNRLDDAEKVLQDAQAADPKNVVPKVRLAQFQTRYRQKPEEAERSLLQFVNEDPDNLQLLGFLGEFYDASGRTAEAIEVYQKLADKAPTAPEGLTARNRLARIDLQGQKSGQALQRVDAVLKDVPDNSTALLMRGEIYYATGRYEDAIADLRGVLRREPDNTLALLLLARTHVAGRDPALAEDAYRRLLQVNPKDQDGLTGLGQLLASDGRVDEAQELVNQALAADPKSVAALAISTELALARKDLALAEKQARLLAAEPDPLGLGQLQIGRVLEARKDYVGANAAYRKSLEIKNDSMAAMDGVIRTLAAQGKLADGTEFVRQHLERHPDHVMARIALAETYRRRGLFKEARESLTDVVASQPELVEAHISLAASYPDDVAERIRILRRGLDANPKSRQLALLLAADYRSQGKIDDAIKVYEDTLKAEPESPMVANNLAAMLLDQRTDADSHKRALDIAQRFANSRSPMELDTLGWAHYRNKDYESATRFLELAAAYGRSEPEVRYHLAMAYIGTKNTAGAKQELERALKDADPKAPWLEEAKKALASL